jgi:hypothetical protein
MLLQGLMEASEQWTQEELKRRAAAEMRRAGLPAQR